MKGSWSRMKFAHITDCHIGAWRNPKLRDLNLKAFENAILHCIDAAVDFIVISGDFFDTNIPHLGPVKKAVELLQLAKSRGIQTYMIYGSHDFTMTNVSMIDILHSTALFIKPTGFEKNGDVIKLQFFTDAKTGAKITGISGRKMGLDAELYEKLDRTGVELEDGFKILLLHKGIREFTADISLIKDCIPLQYLPAGFDYYGGGHIHKRIEETVGESRVVYPGPLFGTNYEDLELTAKGERRGFYIVDFDKKITSCHFIETQVAEIVVRDLQADGLSPGELERKLAQTASSMDVKDKIILIKVAGNLNGKRSEIDFGKITASLYARGALVPILNTNSLTTPEDRGSLEVRGTGKAEIEGSILKEYVRTFKVDPTTTAAVKEKIASLCKDEGMALKLLETFKTEKIENETVAIYDDRVAAMAKSVLSLDGD
jgi:exonuclease SbcD